LLSFLFTPTSTPAFYTLSLHDALPIFQVLHVGLGQRGAVLGAPQDRILGPPQVARLVQRDEAGLGGPLAPRVDGGVAQRPVHRRSEEHTSELQSLAYLVCRLLLEKKKK